MKTIQSYKQLTKIEGFNKKSKNFLKSFLINNILSKNFNEDREFIIYPFWHHVFDDEIKNFKNQINFMKNYGDFIFMKIQLKF